jgi:hypothetical protein
MVLVGMGEDQAAQALAPLGDEARIGQDDLDPGQGLVGEAEAEVDHHPLAAVAVEVEVHADLAGPAERHEEERVVVVEGGHTS